MARKKNNKMVTADELLAEYTVEEIYEQVLTGELERFPNWFWSGGDGEERAARCVRYMLEVKMGLTGWDIPKGITVHSLRQYKLYSLMRNMFNCKLFDMLENAYPGKYKPYMSNAHRGYWVGEGAEEHVREAILWLKDEKLGVTLEEFKQIFCKQILVDNNLVYLTRIYTTLEILIMTFGEDFPIEETETYKHRKSHNHKKGEHYV